MSYTTVLDDKLHWYKDAIIYELHIKAFKDSNGDGIGDFKGLMQQLDYLQELGVTAIWVLPFYPSPLRDDGYDIADYYTINPSYGNIEDFKAFLAEAHRRNLKVITELVINHTSDQHPWFQRARLAPKDSEERNFYVWTDNPNQWKDVRIIFQDYETSNWTWDAVAGQYYWHRFFHHQPDLNYDSPLVQQEIFKILDYWCALGVDGFRLDAVPYLYEREGTNGENLPETHAFLKKLRSHIDAHFPGTVFLAEANMWPEDSASYFGDGDECHMNYHFPVMPRMFMSLQMEDRYPITDIFDQTPAIPETCQWAMFLRNHDELTLEMVTDEERDYMYKVYAKDPKAKINLGIRHRLAPLMANSRQKIELMNCLLFSMPGTPVIYYGDEIGMGDNVYLGDRDGVRTPMQWSPDRNAGFSIANPQRLYLPTIIDPAYHYENVNVEMQRSNTSSLLWFMKRIINMRKRYKAFSRGDMKFLKVENPKVLAFTRTYQDETILVVVNLSKFSQPAEIDLEDFKGYIPIEVFSKNKFPSIKHDAPYFFTLGPHAYQWFVLHKANEDVQQPAVVGLQVQEFSQLLERAYLEELESVVLPDYLLKMQWFVHKIKSIYSLSITNYTLLPNVQTPTCLLLFEVSYESGLPDSYQLPLAFLASDRSNKLGEDCPQAVIAELKVGTQEGLLVDALYVLEFQQWLWQQLATSNTIALSGSSIQMNANDVLANYITEHTDSKPRLHNGDPAYTSITYDGRFFLKMYRKIDPTTNPDIEITRLLSEKLQFEHVPKFIGAIQWQFQNDTIVLGMLQQMIENHGSGETFMLERINNFIERILSRGRETIDAAMRPGTLTKPVAYNELPEILKTLLGSNASEQARMLGVRTGQMHIALAGVAGVKDFAPEEFSLHYQRSLFASFQSAVREAYHGKDKLAQHEHVTEEISTIWKSRDVVLKKLKRIYDHKLDVLKIRIHGNYALDKILFTGKDMVINDFGGDPARTFSERRLKRSPLRDVASMIRSITYVAYEGTMHTTHLQHNEVETLLPYAAMWAHAISGIFLNAYIATVDGYAFVPKNEKDFEVMMETYLLERAIRDLSTEVIDRPAYATVPLQIIQSVLNK